MSGAEQVVRMRALNLLADDPALRTFVHGVFDGTPPRANIPYVSVGAAEGNDWGTKDRAGREVRLTVTLVGAGEGPVGDAAARIEAVLAGLRGAAGGWSIVSVRPVRTRFSHARDGGWRHELVVRCRCLAGL
ncbi:DUF3168 domain-containing protein [Sphingopyxis sp. P8]|uniref:DUF3168 domain-containing protein n=1 Tax=Sphingopyxis sp. P8 TaxID=2763256 RepID=UPI001D0B2872|nr:DUF3168 domain-containing protein [Sphingopyxis sp. P8]